MITQERLKELFNYDPAKGVLVNRVSRQGVQAGAIAGCKTPHGHLIHVDGKTYMRTRLVWLWHHGRFPDGEITHVAGYEDDRIENLRVGSTDEILTVERLRQALSYDAITGVFTWRNDGRRKKRGQEAGWLQKGYRHVVIDRRRYACHRLAWFYMTGNWPTHHIDHIDRNPLNNAFSNLREASNAQNMRNAVGWKNTSGVKGVTWDRSKRKWYAYITVNGKMKALGRYDTLEAAAEVRRAAAEKYHGEFARHG